MSNHFPIIVDDVEINDPTKYWTDRCFEQAAARVVKNPAPRPAEPKPITAQEQDDFWQQARNLLEGD